MGICGRQKADGFVPISESIALKELQESVLRGVR